VTIDRNIIRQLFRADSVRRESSGVDCRVDTAHWRAGGLPTRGARQRLRRRRRRAVRRRSNCRADAVAARRRSRSRHHRSHYGRECQTSFTQ
jgi:hypothetical protein